MIKKFLQMSNDSTSKTLIVALLLCLFCSIIVSTAAVGLKPLQQKNKSADIKQNILQVAGLMQPGANVDDLFENIELRLVNIENGEYVTEIDATSYDQRKEAKNPDTNIQLDSKQDVAKIKRRAQYAKVYLVKENEQIKLIILPVHGYGLWSTMYGFVAIENDGNTIYGLKFYEHGETPGLGGEIDNPKWRDLWQGKTIYDADSEPAITVVRGLADPNTSSYGHQIDGLAGATLTSKGVHNLMRFWLGKNGFGPYLEKFRSGNS